MPISCVTCLSSASNQRRLPPDYWFWAQYNGTVAYCHPPTEYRAFFFVCYSRSTSYDTTCSLSVSWDVGRKNWHVKCEIHSEEQCQLWMSKLSKQPATGAPLATVIIKDGRTLMSDVLPTLLAPRKAMVSCLWGLPLLLESSDSGQLTAMACTRCRPDLLLGVGLSQGPRWILSKTKPLINCAEYRHSALSTRQTARVTTQSPTQSIGLRRTIFLSAQDQWKANAMLIRRLPRPGSNSPVNTSDRAARIHSRAIKKGKESRANWLHLTKITSTNS